MPFLRPVVVAIVNRFPRTIIRRQIPPRCASSQDPNDPFTGEKKTVQDAFGNTITVKQKKTLTGAALKRYEKMKEARRKRGEEVSETESDES